MKALKCSKVLWLSKKFCSVVWGHNAKAFILDIYKYFVPKQLDQFKFSFHHITAYLVGFKSIYRYWSYHKLVGYYSEFTKISKWVVENLQRASTL